MIIIINNNYYPFVLANIGQSNYNVPYDITHGMLS